MQGLSGNERLEADMREEEELCGEEWVWEGVTSREGEVEVVESGGEGADEVRGGGSRGEVDKAESLQGNILGSLPLGAEGEGSCSVEDQGAKLYLTVEDRRQHGQDFGEVVVYEVERAE